MISISFFRRLWNMQIEHLKNLFLFKVNTKAQL